MSAVASFFILPSEKGDALLAAAEAQTAALNKKRFGFLPPKFPLRSDPFWSFVESELVGLEQYPYSGFVLLDLEKLVPGLLSPNEPLGKRLSEVTGALFASYSKKAAGTAIGRLERAELGDCEEALRESAALLGRWLSGVEDGHLGLLNIG